MSSKEQNREAQRKWRKLHPDIARANRIKYHRKLKKAVHDFYGNICNCCGETNPLFLTVDHKNNDGYNDFNQNKKQRVSAQATYIKVIKNAFPDTFQLLCWNCNCGKRMNEGVCPHHIS
jgi:hypothetical protein